MKFKKVIPVFLALLYFSQLAVTNKVFSQANIDAGLILYYPLNGNADDYSGNENHGIMSATGVYPVSNVIGNEYSASLFNGTFEQGMIECPENILNGLQEFSMSYWFNVSSITNAMSLVGQDNNIETGFYTSPNRIAIWHPTSSASVNLNIEPFQWNHFAISLDNTEMKIYLNGALVNTISGDFSLITNTFPPRIGGNVVNQNNNTWLRGSVDEVRFYNRVITQEEVNILAGSLPLTYGITNISNTNICAGSNIDVDYIIIGENIPENNTFYLQISDENGSFNNPITIAEKQSNSSGQFQNVEVPAVLTSSDQYKLRVVSSIPMYVGSPSAADITVFNPNDGLETLVKGRILHYKFNQNTNDHSPYQRHGTAHGGISYIEDRFGNPFSAIQLNGTNGYVDVPQDVWFDGSPFTIATWVKPSAFNSWSRIMDFGVGQGNENITFALTNGTSGNLYALIRRGTAVQFNVTASNTQIGQWSHVVFSFDGEKIKIYINGELSAETESQQPRRITRTTCYIGKSTVAGGNYANAAFDDFMIWNRQLTDDEVRVLANDGLIFTNAPVCDGNTLVLSAPHIENASYNWSGPQSFNSELRMNNIFNAETEMSGIYNLEISKESCSSGVKEKQIDIINDPAQISISFTGLPETSYVGAVESTLTPSPSGGFFSGNGIIGNKFYPELAGPGIHNITYSYDNQGGCVITDEQSISVGEKYLMSNQTVNVCGGGFFDSGGSSSNYQNNEDYTITFCSDNDQKLRFFFKSMNIASGDTLWAYDGDNTDEELIAMYILHSNRDYIWSSGSCLTFRFKSDGSGTGSGWEAEFWCMENPILENEVTDMSTGFRTVCSGTFRDPGGGGNYPLGIVREQTFKSTDGSRLRLDFNMFDLNGNNGGHWLRVYDGPGTNYPLIGSYSQWANPPGGAVQSSGEYLTFRFESLISVGARPGWNADWSCPSPALPVILVGEEAQPTCNAVIYDHAGPGENYHEDRHDISVICSDNNQLIRLLSNHNETQFGEGDTLKIYDGNSTDAQLLAIYIKGSRLDQVVSSTNCITVEFISDDIDNGRGWQTYLTCLEETIPQISYNMSTGERFVCNAKFRDPGGTGNYPRGVWTQTFTSYSGDRLRMVRNSFNVNGNNGGHPFSVYDGPNTGYPLIGTYTNFANPPEIIQSSGSSLTFVFNSTNMSAGTTAGWDFDITCFSEEPIDIAWLNNPICAGEELQIDFTLNESVNPGNVFTAQLSNANGSFNNPIDIGSIQAETSGTITANIPSHISGGTNYKIRIIATDPAMIGNESPNSIMIYPVPEEPVITSNGTTNLCPGETVLLSVEQQQGVIYSWYKNENQQVAYNQNSFVAENQGAYTVIAENSCASVQSANEITVNEIDAPGQFSINAGGETDICSGESVLLYTEDIPGVDYAWKKDNIHIGANQNQISVSEQGEFSLEISNTCGSAVSENSIEVNIIGTAPEQPTISIQGNEISCQGEEVILSVPYQETYNYQWFKDGIEHESNVHSIQPDESGSYSVVVSNLCGSAESLNTKNITFLNEPQNFSIIIIGETEICSNESVTLEVPFSENFDYLWTKDGADMEINQNSIVVNETGMYSAQISNICGTVAANNPVEITVSEPISEFDIFADGDTDICVGEQVTLSAEPQTDAIYSWTKNGNNIGENSNSFDASVAGNYTLIMTNICGQVESNNILTVNTLTAPQDFSLTIIGETEICNNENVTIEAPFSENYNYLWTKDGLDMEINQNTISVNETGFYTAEISNICGSTVSSNGADINVHQSISEFDIFADGNTEFCLGEHVILSTEPQADAIYSWTKNGNNIGDNSNSIVASEAGEYSLSMTNNCGQVQSNNTITIITYSAPQDYDIHVMGETVFCEGESAVLSVTHQPDYNYQWYQNGSEFENNHYEVTVSQSGVYTLEITNFCGTTNLTDNIEIVVNQLPEVSYHQYPEFACYHWEFVLLEGGNPEGGVYQGPGVSSDYLLISEAGLGTHQISYSYTDQNACSNTAYSTITIEECTQIIEQDISSFKVFPNPAKDAIKIVAQLSDYYDITIINSLGQQLYYKAKVNLNNNKEYIIDISNFVGGLYIVNIYNEAIGIKTKTFVIK